MNGAHAMVMVHAMVMTSIAWVPGAVAIAVIVEDLMSQLSSTWPSAAGRL